MGTRDAGPFMARCLTGGIAGGLAAAAWAAVAAGLVGLPLWSPLALYDTHFLGLSPAGVVTDRLVDAVAAGVVWQVLLGMVVAALFGLLAGTLLSERTLARSGPVVGAAYGLLFWAALAASGLRLEDAETASRLPPWAVPIMFALMGLFAGLAGARGLAAPGVGAADPADPHGRR